MKRILCLAAILAGCSFNTQQQPNDRTAMMANTGDPAAAIEVARPGGKLPGDPKVQLVQVAGGFTDPIHVTSARDGSGRLFVCERPGIIKIIDKNGKVLPEPFYNNMANT